MVHRFVCLNSCKIENISFIQTQGFETNKNRYIREREEASQGQWVSHEPAIYSRDIDINSLWSNSIRTAFSSGRSFVVSGSACTSRVYGT